MASAHTKATKRGRILTVALALVTATFVLAAGCEEQPTIEPSGTREIGRTTTTPADPKAISHLPPGIFQMHRALAWTDQEEKIIWPSVNDFDLQWRETAFFMAMQRVRKVKPLPIDDFKLLDYPSYSSLMTDPGHYRAKPIRLSIRVYTLVKLEPGKHFTATRRWTLSDGPIWRMNCGNAMIEYPGDEPLSVFCAFDPTSLIGRPHKVNQDGEAIYRGGKRVEIAGVFYKVYRDMDRGDKGKDRQSQLRRYPIVLAWQFIDPFARVGPPSIDPRVIMIILIVAVLAAAYLILRRTLKRPVVQRGWRRTYRPIRTIEMGEDLFGKETHTNQDNQDNQDNQEGDIDPLLRAASRQYRKEKGLDDE